MGTVNNVNIDSLGNLYIYGGGDYRIRKVDTSGIITTVAGNGTYGFSREAGSGHRGTIHIPFGFNLGLIASETSTLPITEIIESVELTPRASSQLSPETARQVSPGDGGPATEARLFYQQGVTVDSTGNLFIADQWEAIAFAWSIRPASSPPSPETARQVSPGTRNQPQKPSYGFQLLWQSIASTIFTLQTPETAASEK